MDNHLETLLAAERRGRALVLRERPGPQTAWRLDALPGADGLALLAAARWAARLGADVAVAAAPCGEPRWDALIDGARRQGLLDDSRAAGRNLLNGQPPALPDADRAWAIPLAESSPMILSVSPDMPALSCAQAREVDRAAIGDFAVPGVCLMENAAVAAVAAAMDMLAGVAAPSVAIVAGGGNNGGDGFAMARGLDGLGAAVDIALLKPVHSLKGDALENFRLLAAHDRVRLHHLDGDQTALPALLAGKSLIVDALLGTGFAGDLSPAYRRAIEAINAAGVPVLAVDIPSGLNGDSGLPAGDAVRAKRTITFAAVKTGLVRAEAGAYAGELLLGDIGAPAGCYPG